MKNNIKKMILGNVFALMMATAIVGCGKNDDTSKEEQSTVENETNDNERVESGSDRAGEDSESQMKKTSSDDSGTDSKNKDSSLEGTGSNIVASDLTPSEGLEFLSNGDGTCTIVGTGSCSDRDIVIPTESPEGETVVLIDEYALYSLEDVDSVTLLNYCYDVGENAFQYGEFTTLNIIGGTPNIDKRAFSSCDKLENVNINNCEIYVDEYGFYGIGKEASLVFENCSGIIDENVFQYSELTSITINACDLDFDARAFSSCEDITSITISDSSITTEEYAFYGCGKRGKLEIKNSDISLGENCFQYSSLESIVIEGTNISLDDRAFSSCEDLTSVSIEGEDVSIGEYTFYGCEDLESVSICEKSGDTSVIEIGDDAFQYCDDLLSVTIGNGELELGKYVFSGGPEDMTISIAGTNYTPDDLKKGID
jgi:hypothetical protein